MTTLTDTQVITASGGLVELGYSQITSNVTVNNNVAGTGTVVISPLTVVCDGGPVLVEFHTTYAAAGSASNLTISLFKDGAEFSRSWGFVNPGGTNVPVKLTYRDTPTAGSHTYEVRAYYGGGSAGTIIAGSGTTGASPAFLRVSKIVQATQWPAVTTGTIIATSSTRPASPFEGQTIYETDTDLSYTYTGSAWVSPDVAFRAPVCVLAKSISVTNAGVNWDFTAAGDEESDTDNMHSTSSNSTRITPATPGVYALTASQQGGSSGDLHSITIWRNRGGSNSVMAAQSNTVTGYGTHSSVATAAVAQAGDYFFVEAYSSVTRTLNCRFTAAWIGKA